ncbi:cyclic peptide export ABC transporter [Hyalangium versicolor]|uniref:cyclic peptide export ABC transporter n=1 Tax=Hyalangium versicolor TaxID=2861190 RepID=UPI001CCCD519|nr:cyclic peptide export ABC transporter [Hyalangium versicolor]
MNFLKFLHREAGALTVRLLTAAGLSGLLNGLLIVVVLAATGMNYRSPEQTPLLLVFIAAFALFAICRKFVLDRASGIVEGIVSRVRVRISDKVRGADLMHFEQLGAAPVYAALAEDTRTLSDSASFLISSMSSALLVVLAMLFIGVLSTSAFFMVATLLALGALVYVRNARATRPALRKAAEEEHRFFKELGHLLYGFKELKIDAEKSQALFEQQLKVVAHRAEQLRVEAAQRFNRATVFGECFFYGLMGVLIFVLPALTGQQNSRTLVSVIAVLLFITSSVTDVVNAIPSLEKADVAIDRLEALETSLGPPPPPPSPVDNSPFESLRCEGVKFRYPDVEGRHAFELGPINLEVRRGELIFLIGGNGSGKSTFLKLLCGLYPSTAGTLELNSVPVIPSTLQAYRSKFAIVLQDFHLFDRLFHTRKLDHARIAQLLTAFDLASVTGIREDGQLANTQLSKGQQKRLALLITELEDREVLIFDEWAADQDPEFRRYFYQELLGSLVARGKTVIAATHDDHYFHLADRVLKMSEGKLEPYENHPRARGT